MDLFITAYDTFGRPSSIPLYSYDTHTLLLGDVDGDSDVDIFDLMAAAGNYGKSW